MRPYRVLSGLACVLLACPIFADNLPVPPNIVTSNVPDVDRSVSERLQRYANTRSASLVGWQGSSALVATRFGETTQLHRVSEPLGYREQLTFFSEPVGGVTAPRGGATDQVIIRRDTGGSEFFQLFLFDLRTGASRMVTDGKSRYGSAMWSPDEQSFVYTTTERNGRDWDLHVQTLDGKITPVLETDGGAWSTEDWSTDGKRLLVGKYVSINESYLYELDLETRKLTPLLDHDKTFAIGQAEYDGRGGVYFTSDQGSEYMRLSRLDLSTGDVEVVTGDTPWNVEAFGLSEDKSKLVYSINEGGVSKLHAWRLPQRRAIRLPDLPQGVLTSVAFTADGKGIGLSINSPLAPSDVYRFEFGSKKLERWTRSEIGGLDRSRFVDAELIEYDTFDGRSIPAFVYRPRTPGPHPVVISIHGGPEGQYRPYFSTTVQSYVQELDVVYIAPNVRGSSGYGKSYLKLDNGKLREDSVKDIGALLDWIDTQPSLDSNKVAVMGGSYGGYMVLACMVHYGDRLAAAAESVGISNFVTFLENTQAYRQDLRRAEYGDERDPAMRTFLEEISPLNHVDKMVTPVLISQGANDPRVPASESEQIVSALQAAEVPAWYILAKDEGHGFRKKGNRDYANAVRFEFLKQNLQGNQTR
jgi:dipeptidyl aminopeptidase/acylaminoacyl peptidase